MGSTDGSEPEPGLDVGSIGRTKILEDIFLMSVQIQRLRDPAFERRCNSPYITRVTQRGQDRI